MKTTISTRAFSLVCLFCLSAVGLWSTPLLNNWSFLSEDYVMSTHNSSYWGRSVYVLSNPDIWLEQDDCEEVFSSSVMAITVNVFNDYDSDGTDDGAGEPGISGLTVMAYDAMETATMLADGGNGSYTFTPGNTNTYRIEVTGLSSDLEPSVAGTTTVFFASQNDVVNVGVHRPGEHYPESIFLATPCYVEGGTNGPNANGDVMVIVPENSLTPGAGNVNPTEYFVANHSDIGATFGTAYSRSSNSLFASAFMKRHTAFGPGGTGAIYKIDLNGEVPTAPISSTGISTFIDLNSLFGTNTAGVNPHPNGSDFNRDPASYDAVGKRGLGGLALSETDNVLWTINLEDRRLYEIPLGGTPDNPTAPASMSVISRWPATGDLTGLPGLTGTASDIRPFAVKCYRGEIYIGLVNTAESTVGFNAGTNTLTNTGDRSAMRGFIYKFNPDTDTFTKLLEFPLNYTRGQAIDFCGNNAQGEFYPWTPIFDSDVMLTTVMGTTSPPGGNFIGERAYPQPWLTDIEFDEAGKMIIGIRDRFADQHGYNRLPPSTMEPNVQFTADAAGDILVASINTTDNTTYVLENNSSNGANGAPFGPTTGINKAEGPGNGEFFFDDRYRPSNAPGDGPSNCPGGTPDTNDEDPILDPGRQQGHDETSLGGVLVHNGQMSVIMSNYDPLNDWNLPFNNAGMMKLSTTTGARLGGNQIYATPSDPGTFAKGNGLGDIEGVGGRAPIEIGNRLWLDANNNGRQDADEDGINGVTVRLFKDVGGGTFNEVASTTTAANAIQGNGFFIFSSATDADVLPGMNYEIRVDLADVQAIENTVTDFTTTDAGGNTTNDNKTDLNDSDASSTGVIAFSTGAAGQNNHSLDVGVVSQLVLDCTLEIFAVQVSSCMGNQFDATITVAWDDAPAGDLEYNVNDGAYIALPRPAGATGTAEVNVELVLTGLTCDQTKDVNIRFQGDSTCEQQAVFVFPPTDPAGYIYCTDDGSIISGSRVRVNTPPGGTFEFITDADGVLLDGRNGRYSWVITGAPAVSGMYSMTIELPDGGTIVTNPTTFGDGDSVLDPTIGSGDNPNPGEDPLLIGSDVNMDGDALVDFTLASNPYFLNFDLAQGDAFVDLNNIPVDCSMLEPCDCEEYVYLNEVSSGGVVHKFSILDDGNVTEIFSDGRAFSDPPFNGPWYPGTGTSELPNPHGLGIDRNGFLYIGENFTGGSPDIRRLACDGTIFPETGPDGFVIQNSNNLFNVTSYDGVIYSNGDGQVINAWDPCTGNSLGTVTLSGFGGNDWGFHINQSTGVFYATSSSGAIWRFVPTEADFTANTSYTAIITPDAGMFGIGEPFTSNNQLQGITSDDNGTIYVIEGNRDAINTPSRILKYDADGLLIEIGPTDSNGSDNMGWNQMVGIVYSETANRLYTSSLNQNEDCLISWNADNLAITDTIVHVGPIPGPGRAKGIAIATECCPTNPNEVVNLVQCVSPGSDPISLNEIFPCDGIICEAQWEPADAAAMAIYESCDQTILSTATAGCYTFTRTSDGAGAKQCGQFTQTLNLEIVELSDITVGPTDQTIACLEAAEDLVATTTGNIVRWESNTVSPVAADELWTPIPGTAGLTTYSPGSPSTTTFYRAVLGGLGPGNGSSCPGGDCELPSNVVTITTPDDCPDGPFDLALTKVANTTEVLSPGDPVTFTIEVFNQGNIDAVNVEISDYIPDGLELDDANWTEMPSGTAVLNMPIASIPASTSETVTITFIISTDFTGTSITNDAEITGADNDGDDGTPPPTDIDSTPGDNATPNDTGNDDDTADTEGGDDQDPAVIQICPSDCGSFPWDGSSAVGAPPVSPGTPGSGSQ